MLKIKDLKKDFGEKKVLKGINLTVNKGDVLGIIGPSGCGKSTLLRCINYLEKPTSGTIILDNKEITNKDNLANLRKKVGMVFQHFNLFENLKVIDNIILAPVKLGLLNKKEALIKADELLKKIGLEDKKDYYPRQLSGGQKQRIAIVRALIMNPELMLFDEPTSALDPEMIGEVTSLMRQIAKEGMTMIVISHETNFIKNFATRIALMEDGQITLEGTPKELLGKLKKNKVKDFLSKVENI